MLVLTSTSTGQQLLTDNSGATEKGILSSIDKATAGINSDTDQLSNILDKSSFNNEDFAQENTLSDNEINTGNIDTNTDQIEPKLDKIDQSTDNFEKALIESRTLFGEIGVASRNLEIDLVSDQGTSVLRDIKTTNGSATIPQQPAASGELQIKTGSTPGSQATLETANLGRYSPGQPAQVGIGIRQLEIPEGGEEWKAGYFDDTDGYYFGRNSTCLYVAQLSKGDVDKTVCRENWNGQDIENQLGREWNMSDGAILQIDYSWYGYGAVRFSVVDTKNLSIDDASPRDVQNTVPVHTFTPEASTSITDPIQPVRVDVQNDGSGNSYELRVGGRQYSVFGDRSKVSRISNDGVETVTVDSTDYQCLIGFKKEGTKSAANTEVQFYGVQTVSSSALTEVAVLYNANLTSQGSYTQMDNTPDEESSLLSNKNCQLDSVSGDNVGFAEPNGTEIWNQYVSGSSSRGNRVSPGKTQVNGLNAKLPTERNVVVVARSVDGTSTDVTTNVRFTERK